MPKNNTLQANALAYHAKFPAGKMYIQTKQCNQEQLKLAYSPGVGYVCQEIQEHPEKAKQLTMTGNNVCVITNGTAVLGFGDIGALAGKPVMEGKALLMKQLAGIDATELCVQEKNVDKLYEIIKACSVSFGCINLEDIKAPECFELLERLQAELDMPVFHDDQDGTAAVATAALINALKIADKDIAQVKVVASGAGAAMIATLRLMEEFGLDRKNVYVFDSKGLIHKGRTNLNQQKALYQQEEALSITQALDGADVFIGLSAPGVINQGDLKNMKKDPVLLTMANPEPEIKPEEIKAARPDAIIGTGRADYPNQVNNSSCFPYLFRGVLDVQASKITLNMIKAVVEGLIELVGDKLSREYIIPSTLDPALPYAIVPKVMFAAIKDGVGVKADRLSMHKHLLPVSLWDVLEALPAKNQVQVQNSRLAECLKGLVGANNPWQLQEGVGKGLHLFKNGFDLFVLDGQGRTVLGLPVYSKLDIEECKKLHHYIGAIDLDSKIAYCSEGYREAMLLGLLVSRL